MSNAFRFSCQLATLGIVQEVPVDRRRDRDSEGNSVRIEPTSGRILFRLQAETIEVKFVVLNGQAPVPNVLHWFRCSN